MSEAEWPKARPAPIRNKTKNSPQCPVRLYRVLVQNIKGSLCYIMPYKKFFCQEKHTLK
jgi:hypothetical protein